MKLLRLFPFLVFFAAFNFSACKTNQFNKHGKRTGRWEFTDTLGTHLYQYGGRYRNGIEKGTWKYYFDGRLARLEKYCQETAYNTFFRANGKVHSEGKSRLEVSGELIHWYYFGDWHFYDENGRLMLIKTFEKGNPVKTVKIEPAANP